MNNINKHNDGYYWKRLRCENCGDKKDMEAGTNTGNNNGWNNRTWERYVNYMYSYQKSPYEIQFCHKCKMETLHKFIAMQSFKKGE